MKSDKVALLSISSAALWVWLTALAVALDHWNSAHRYDALLKLLDVPILLVAVTSVMIFLIHVFVRVRGNQYGFGLLLNFLLVLLPLYAPRELSSSSLVKRRLSKTNQSLQSSLSPIPRSPSVTRQLEQTEEWKTLTVAELSYSIQYPPDWYFGVTESDGFPYIRWVDPIAQLGDPGQTHIDRGAMIIVSTGPWLGQDTSILSLKRTLELVDFGLGDDSTDVLEISESSIGDIAGARSSFITEDHRKETFVFLRASGDKTLVFRIELSVFGLKEIIGEHMESYLSVFQQMLNTLEIPSTINETKWSTYKNKQHGFSLRYPSRLKVKEYSSPSTFSVMFSSLEAEPNALEPDMLIPGGEEAWERFKEQYARVGVILYDNQANLPLKQFVRQQYSASGLDPKKTEFELMEPDLKPYDGGPRGELIFVGSVREDPGKIIFFTHKDKVYEIGLGGGAGGTGSVYSKTAEKVFDEMVASIFFQ